MRDMRDENRYGWRDDDRDFDQGYQGNYGQGGYGSETKYGQGYGQGYQGGYGQGTYSQGEWNRGSGRGYGQGRRGRFGYGEHGWRGSEWHGRDWRSGENANMGQADQGTRYTGLTNDWDEDRGRFAGRGPKGYKRSDDRIREDVSDRLTDDSWLDASSIEVKVESGMVTLSGNVGSRDDKRRAEDVAMSCSGVKDVINQIHVDQGILDQVADAFGGGSKKSDETREKATVNR